MILERKKRNLSYLKMLVCGVIANNSHVSCVCVCCVDSVPRDTGAYTDSNSYRISVSLTSQHCPHGLKKNHAKLKGNGFRYKFGNRSIRLEPEKNSSLRRKYCYTIQLLAIPFLH